MSELRVGALLGAMSHVPSSAPQILHRLPSIIPVPDPLRWRLSLWLLSQPAWTLRGHRLEQSSPAQTAQQNAVVSLQGVQLCWMWSLSKGQPNATHL